MNALELAIRDHRFKGASNHHIFLKFIPEVVIEPEKVNTILRTLGEHYGRRMWKLRVSEVEVMGLIKQGSTVIPVRFFATNPTGYHFSINSYIEVKEQDKNKTRVLLASIDPRHPGHLNGKDISDPYPAFDIIDQKRYFLSSRKFQSQCANIKNTSFHLRLLARQSETTYVYDFVELFHQALREIWDSYSDLVLSAASTLQLFLEQNRI